MINGSNLTSERVAEYLASGKRFDGRKPDEFRNIEIDVNLSKKAEGGAKVKIGETEVWVGVKMGLGTPYLDSPNEGTLMVTAELTPLSHEKYEYGPPKFPTIELGRLVDRAIRESGLMNLKELCIKEGEKVWTAFIDVYSVNDAGNLLDAAVIGALAALKSTKVPVYDEKTDKIDYDKEPTESFPLSDKFPLNFSVYKIGDNILLDPTLEEESASEGRLILAATQDKPIRICSMQKSQTMDLTTEQFGSMLDMVESNFDKLFKEINKKIEEAIKKKEKK